MLCPLSHVDYKYLKRLVPAELRPIFSRKLIMKAPAGFPQELFDRLTFSFEEQQQLQQFDELLSKELNDDSAVFPTMILLPENQ